MNPRPIKLLHLFPEVEVKVLKWHYQYWADVKIMPGTAAAGHLAPLSCDNGASGGNHLAMFPMAPNGRTVITSSVRIEDPISFPGQQDRVDPQPQHEHDDQELQWRHRERRSILWID